MIISFLKHLSTSITGSKTRKRVGSEVKVEFHVGLRLVKKGGGMKVGSNRWSQRVDLVHYGGIITRKDVKRR